MTQTHSGSSPIKYSQLPVAFSFAAIGGSELYLCEKLAWPITLSGKIVGTASLNAMFSSSFRGIFLYIKHRSSKCFKHILLAQECVKASLAMFMNTVLFHNLGSPLSYHTWIFYLMSSRNMYPYNA